MTNALDNRASTTSPLRTVVFWVLALLGLPAMSLGWFWIWLASDEASRGTAGSGSSGPSIPFMLAPLVVAHLMGLALLAAVMSGASTRLTVKVLLVLSVVVFTSAVGLAGRAHHGGANGRGRLMTEPRKSAKQTEARRRARERAAKFCDEHDKLEQLAVDYFVATDSLEEMGSATEREIAAVRARAEKQSAKARSEAQSVAQKMLALGATRAEVAVRLGVAVRDIKKSLIKT